MRHTRRRGAMSLRSIRAPLRRLSNRHDLSMSGNGEIRFWFLMDYRVPLDFVCPSREYLKPPKTVGVFTYPFGQGKGLSMR